MFTENAYRRQVGLPARPYYAVEGDYISPGGHLRLVTAHSAYKVAGGVISLAGLVLLGTICADVRSNIWWMSRPVLFEERFGFYLWVSVAIALMFVLRGVVTWLAVPKMPLVIAETLLTVGVAGASIVVASGWRIRTDVRPEDAIQAISELPLPIRILADPLISRFFVGSVLFGLLVILWSQHRRGNQG